MRKEEERYPWAGTGVPERPGMGGDWDLCKTVSCTLERTNRGSTHWETAPFLAQALSPARFTPGGKRLRVWKCELGASVFLSTFNLNL